ncbi:MAG: DNA translocase FtsK [Chloroflexi bacterium]|nr:DNA translocase FtsK [Chloroflexota bacterium]
MGRAAVSSARGLHRRTRRHDSRASLYLLGILLALLAGAGVALLLWPFLGFGVGALALWAVAVLVVLKMRPRWLLRVNLWLALLVLVMGVAGILALVAPGSGGVLGQWIAGSYPALGVLRLAGVVLVAAALGVPQPTWKATQWLAGVASAMARRVAMGYRVLPLDRSLWRLVRSLAIVLFRAWRRQPGSGGLASTGGTPSRAGRKTIPAVAVDAEEAPEGPGQRRGGRSVGGWRLPPLAMLDEREEYAVSEEENLEKAQLIERTLSDYGIEVGVDEIRPGPVVTQFGLVPGWVRKYREVRERDREGRPKTNGAGSPVFTKIEEKTRVKVDTVLQREKDLALALAASSIRFEAPVPGESFVGLEVPNSHPSVVTLRSLMATDTFRALRRKGQLPTALGKGSGGEAVVADLAEMPHLLIAGATGSGKSVCINTVIAGLLMQFTPYDVRLLMVDPKRVELTPYNGIPHLVTPVIVEAETAVPILKGLIGEMKERYKRLEAVGARTIQVHNQKVQSLDQHMPYLVVVIDELADLMMSAPVDVEHSLCRLAQLGRAVGIHLVVATQRPSVDVITGLIKANFPSRVSFAVSSQVDSRTILDSVGAEKLLGKGDMLFLPINLPKSKRLQGTYISDDEVSRLVAHWKDQPSKYVPPLVLAVPQEEEGDELLERAKDLASKYNHISASLLQRKLNIGYPRAARLMDRLEEMGLVAVGEPGKARETVRGEEDAEGER